MRWSSSSNPSDGRLTRRGLLLAAGAGVLALRAAAAGAPSALMACTRTAAGEPDRQEVLRDAVRIVIVPTLQSFADGADSLEKAALALRESPSASVVAAARTAFLDARTAWKRAEVFLIGPTDDLAVTGGAIDAWPAAGDKIDALVAGTDALDVARAGTLAANLRGFPGIEWLLFDAVAGEPEADRRLLDDTLAPRRRELVAGLASDLAAHARAVVSGWVGNTGYGFQLAEAGNGSTVFGLQREGIDKLVTAMLTLTETVQMLKLGTPLGIDTGGAPKPTAEEAPRSDFSLVAIEQNLVGLQSAYECRVGAASGQSLANEVRKVAPEGDATFRNALEGALSVVRSIKTPMRTLLVTDAAPLVQLHAAVQATKRSLRTDVASALGASLGFGFSDTD